MILVDRHPFTVARYHRRIRPGYVEADKGLVIPVAVQCDSWMGGSKVVADAFIDPGADVTILSLRWIAEHSSSLDFPRIDQHHCIRDDSLHLEIGGQHLKVPVGPFGARLRRQGQSPPPGWEMSQLWDDSLDMPGYEDILLGRDFLAAHGLLLLLDFYDRCFSLLQVQDADDLRRRELARSAFAP